MPVGAQRTAGSVERIARILSDEIVSGARRPGDRLVAGDIATQWGVSRVPVREAFRVLAQSGLVTLTPNRGAAVFAESDPSDLRAVLETRLRIEPWAMTHAARDRTTEDLTSLRHELDLGQSAAAAHDLLEAVRAHARLLDHLAAATHHRPVEAALRPLYLQTGALFTRAIGAPHGHGWEHHTRVVDAIQMRDAQLAENLAREHLTVMLDGLSGGSSDAGL